MKRNLLINAMLALVTLTSPLASSPIYAAETKTVETETALTTQTETIVNDEILEVSYAGFSL